MKEGVMQMAEGHQLAGGEFDAVGFREHVLALGDKNGVVEFDDILKVMPDVEENTELLQDVFTSLMEKGIEIGDSGNSLELDDVEDILDEDEDGFDDPLQDAASDSVALYLRDIGKVDLLTAKEEVALAKRIEACAQAKPACAFFERHSRQRRRGSKSSTRIPRCTFPVSGRARSSAGSRPR